MKKMFSIVVGCLAMGICATHLHADAEEPTQHSATPEVDTTAAPVTEVPATDATQQVQQSTSTDDTTISAEATIAPDASSDSSLISMIFGEQTPNEETAGLEAGLAFLRDKFTKIDPTLMQKIVTTGSRATLALVASIGSHALLGLINPSNTQTSGTLRLVTIAALLGGTSIALHEILGRLMPNAKTSYSDLLADFFDHWTEYETLIPSDYLSTLSTAYNAYIANGKKLTLSEDEAKTLTRTIRYDAQRRLTT